MITVRKATLDDNKGFAELLLLSAPYFQFIFGDKTRIVLQNLFRYRSNLFSFEHVYFAEVDGKKAGMILGYDRQTKRKEDLKTGYMLFKEIGVNILGKFLLLMKFNTTVGKVCKDEYYISNIATYPQFRGKGVGKRLIFEAAQEAKLFSAKRIVLDVEKNNISAIKLYGKLGYKMTKSFSIPLQRDKVLYLNRMIKEVE